MRYILFIFVFAGLAFGQATGSRPTYTISANLTVSDTVLNRQSESAIVFVTKNATVKLPHAASIGICREFYVRLTAGVKVVLTIQDSDLVNGAASFSDTTAKSGFILFNDGVKNWYTVGKQ